MNNRAFLIICAIAILIGGIGLYIKVSSATDEKKICIFASNIPGNKEYVSLISQALVLHDIKKNQIVDVSKKRCENSSIKIFLDQKKFSESIKNDDTSLKIGVQLHIPIDEENPKVIGLLEENNIQQLLELIENIVKHTVNCLVIYDDQDAFSRESLAQYQEIAKIKGITLQPCALSTKNNVATILKKISSNINSIILLPSSLIFSEFELILEQFKLKKLPVFANHSGLVRAGALGGYDFDMQEVAYDIAKTSSSFLSGTMKKDVFEEVYPQLHLNMDTIRHLGIQLESEDFLDGAVTVGGADL